MPSKAEFDTKLVEQIADLMTEKGLTEVEINDGSRTIRVARGTAVPVAAAMPAPAKAAEPEAEPAESAEQHPGTVSSPMVGTAYLAPQPGAADFVRPGDTVSEGQTLLIIEAMKVMNPIPAPRAGRVSRIFVSNEQPVEFGEPLLILE